MGGRLAQDLIGLAQLAVLALQGLDALLLRRGRPGPQTLVTLGLADPLAQGLGRAPNFGRDRADGRPLRGVVAPMIQHHPHRTLPDLRRKLVRGLLGHGSTFSRVGASGKPGAVQDGRTYLAYKPEHAIDLDTGAMVAAEMHPADRGDTATLPGTLDSAARHLAAV